VKPAPGPLNYVIRLFDLPLAVGLMAAALAFAWQSLTVHFNYRGNWTALFCTDSLTPVPPTIAHEEICTFSGSAGYDGQYYHFMARDSISLRGLLSAFGTA